MISKPNPQEKPSLDPKFLVTFFDLHIGQQFYQVKNPIYFQRISFDLFGLYSRNSIIPKKFYLNYYFKLLMKQILFGGGVRF